MTPTNLKVKFFNWELFEIMLFPRRRNSWTSRREVTKPKSVLFLQLWTGGGLCAYAQMLYYFRPSNQAVRNFYKSFKFPLIQDNISGKYLMIKKLFLPNDNKKIDYEWSLVVAIPPCLNSTYLGCRSLRYKSS